MLAEVAPVPQYVADVMTWVALRGMGFFLLLGVVDGLVLIAGRRRGRIWYRRGMPSFAAATKSLLCALVLGAAVGACGDDAQGDSEECVEPVFTEGASVAFGPCGCDGGAWDAACAAAAGHSCWYSYDGAGVKSGGVCQPPCDDDGGCPDFNGQPSQCFAGTCTAPCGTGCPAGMVCRNQTDCAWPIEKEVE